jgi:hypothetical protein
MTESEYTERNELISDFMDLRSSDDYHIHPTPARGVCRAQFLQYHHNRNWLHRVWERFRDLRWDDNAKAELEHADFKQNIAHCLCYRDIDSAFQSIVSGIQWYNSINK